MANYKAVSTGVWSALARWQDDSSGSYVASTVLPGAADVVYANNFTVTLDIDVVVLELRNNSTTNVTLGGTFNFGAANSVTANIFGNVNNVGCITNNTLSGIKTVIGNSTGGANGNSIGIYCIGGSSQTTVIGNVIGGTTIGGNGVRCDAGTVTIIGNVSASAFGYGAYVRTTSSATLIINGTSTGSATTSIPGTFSEFANSNCIVDTAIAQTGPGVGISSSGQVTVKNIVMSSSGVFGITGGSFRFDNAGPNSIQVIKQNNTTQLLTDNSTVNYPVEADVRNLVQYGPGNIYTGSLIAMFTPAEFITALGTSSDPLAVRLQNVATVQTTGDQIAAAL